ncbi:MAG TPA: aminotransferase class III-fold pyridoxal phosphate-dependent enzyme [Gemmatimonadaceae bacterium]|jgi:glutamate-1-semialdehyde 2,1-aminomutase|nr:aminotransferase class III-fold pyridoxal phosphate-dependent enzyme [Gemmatimonadaceae bacterium]
MVFKRLFDRASAADASSEDAGAGGDATEVESGDSAIAPESEEFLPEETVERSWADRAAAVIPGGSSTGSKQPRTLYGVETPDAPTHFAQASGCHVVTPDGATYVDCTMALGAVALGYAEPNVTHAVMDAVGGGNVSGLNSTYEVEAAERLAAIVPCAERVRFLKSGAEATAAALRLARTYTGRDVVVACGYFGWHDWSSEGAGIPGGARQDVIRVPFDDVAVLEATVAEVADRLAAVILEPVIERMPSDAWIARARELCTRHGAVLIFDEMKTGFRLAPGGYQEVAGVTPDLATFGKALANGFPLAAVCGVRDVMDAASRTWISSTLAGEAGALAAAIAVMAWHEQADICQTLQRNGAEMRRVVSAAVQASGVAGVRVEGLDQMWLLRFDDPALEVRFVQGATRHGVLFKRGAYNYASVAHDDEVVRVIEGAASRTFVELVEGA